MAADEMLTRATGFWAQMVARMLSMSVPKATVVAKAQQP